MSGKYIYMQDLSSLEELVENFPGPSWPICPSPVCLENWSQFLQCHPDKAFASYIHNGFSAGFRIGFDRKSTKLRSRLKNHPSTQANQAIVSSHIHGDLQSGHLVGPVAEWLQPHVHTSPLGLIPKNHQINKWRLIMDLSSPPKQNVNDDISTEYHVQVLMRQFSAYYNWEQAHSWQNLTSRMHTVLC